MAYEKINAEIIPEGFEIHPNFQNLEPEMKVAIMSGIKGDKGDKGDKGNTGTTGATGATGNGIASAELNDDYTLTLTFTDGTSYTTESIRGEQGDTGTAATVSVGNVSSGSTASVTNSGTSSAAVFDFTLPKGDKGDTGNTGATGNGIASITKTGTSGLVDTYTITMTSGATSTFTVTNGQDGTGDMLKSTYDTDNDGIVDNAEKVNHKLTITLGSTDYEFDGSSDVTVSIVDGNSLGYGEDDSAPIVGLGKVGYMEI